MHLHVVRGVSCVGSRVWVESRCLDVTFLISITCTETTYTRASVLMVCGSQIEPVFT